MLRSYPLENCKWCSRCWVRSRSTTQVTELKDYGAMLGIMQNEQANITEVVKAVQHILDMDSKSPFGLSFQPDTFNRRPRRYIGTRRYMRETPQIICVYGYYCRISDHFRVYQVNYCLFSHALGLLLFGIFSLAPFQEASQDNFQYRSAAPFVNSRWMERCIRRCVRHKKTKPNKQLVQRNFRWYQCVTFHTFLCKVIGHSIWSLQYDRIERKQRWQEFLSQLVYQLKLPQDSSYGTWVPHVYHLPKLLVFPV